MSDIWITSDTHFCHDKEFLYEPRGFHSVAAMNEAIVENWNSVVKPDDLVFLLGDVMLNDTDAGLEYLKQLNGFIEVIRGNHDTDTRISRYWESNNIVNCTKYSTVIKLHKQHIYLSHYPTICGNYDTGKPLKSRMLNICGHSHTKDPFADWDKGLIFHAEMDTNNCTPWNLEDILKLCQEKYYS